MRDQIRSSETNEMLCTILLPVMFLVLAASDVLFALEPPGTNYDWTTEHMAERNWFAEHDEFSVYVYVHSPGRRMKHPIPGSYFQNSVDLTV